MFISKKEKELIEFRFNESSSILEKLISEISSLKDRVFDLEKRLEKPKPHKPTEEELKIEIRKAKGRAYAREYYKRKQEAKKVLNVGS